MRSQANGEVASIRSEIGPIVRHAVVVIILMCAFTVVGLLLRAIREILVEFDQMFRAVEMADIVLVVSLFWLFAFYTLGTVVIRLWRALLGEIYPARRDGALLDSDKS